MVSSEDEDIASRVAQTVESQHGEAIDVLSAKPLIGGACQDLYRVELRRGDERELLVLRSDARSSLPGSLTRRQEFPIISAAHEAGVATPAVRWLCEDLLRPGASSYFMEWVDGVTIARKLLRDPELASARANLAAELATNLACLHALPAVNARGLSMPTSPAREVLAQHRRAVNDLPEPRPVLELALHWMGAHLPAKERVVLCHGDFRTGNFAVGKEGLCGILDWEFAHWGDATDDIAWLCLRDWRFGNLKLAAGGFATREVFYAEYEKASGHAVDRARIQFWEIANTVRWTIGAIFQGERYLSGGEKDLELIAIGRRVPQLEFEILRLLSTTRSHTA